VCFLQLSTTLRLLLFALGLSKHHLFTCIDLHHHLFTWLVSSTQFTLLSVATKCMWHVVSRMPHGWLSPAMPTPFNKLLQPVCTFPTGKLSVTFLPHGIECRCGLVVRKLSVCLSVCQTRALWQNRKMICPDFYIFIPHERTLSIVFWEEEWLVRGDHFFCLSRTVSELSQLILQILHQRGQLTQNFR